MTYKHAKIVLLIFFSFEIFGWCLDKPWPGNWKFFLTSDLRTCHSVDGLVLTYIVVACTKVSSTSRIWLPVTWHISDIYLYLFNADFIGNLNIILSKTKQLR